MPVVNAEGQGAGAGKICVGGKKNLGRVVLIELATLIDAPAVAQRVAIGVAAVSRVERQLLQLV